MIYLTIYHLMLNYFLITHFFSVIHDITVSAGRLNGDLKKKQRLGFSMEKHFNPDASKQAQ